MGSNPINTDTEGAIGSVCINRVSVLRGSHCLSPKTPSTTKQNAKEIVEGLEDISIFK